MLPFSMNIFNNCTQQVTSELSNKSMFIDFAGKTLHFVVAFYEEYSTHVKSKNAHTTLLHSCHIWKNYKCWQRIDSYMSYFENIPLEK